METWFVILIAVGVVVWIFWHFIERAANERGKKIVEYLGYNWDVCFVKRGGRKKEMLHVQSVDARNFLMNQCKTMIAMQGAFSDMVDEYPGMREYPKVFSGDFNYSYMYVQAGSNYKPLADGGAPEVVYLYATFLGMLDPENDWDIKSIDPAGWSEVGKEKVLVSI